MASAEFGADSESKRPTVQVGDPFTEKLLIEACLELMATDAIIAIQDMGAAGLTSSAVEMAGKGGVGIELDMDAVPQRETGMSAYEMMLSESQERMLMVLRPDRQEMARAIFGKWELEFAVIGHLTDTGRISCCATRVRSRRTFLWTHWPNKRRYTTAQPLKPQQRAPLGLVSERNELDGRIDQADGMPRFVLARLGMGSVRQHHRRPDRQTARRRRRRHRADRGPHPGPGADHRLHAAVLPGRSAYLGGMQAVAEAWRNITATGATPLAITDNMNFGNPEKPAVMGQFAAAVQRHLRPLAPRSISRS